MTLDEAVNQATGSTPYVPSLNNLTGGFPFHVIEQATHYTIEHFIRIVIDSTTIAATSVAFYYSMEFNDFRRSNR